MNSVKLRSAASGGFALIPALIAVGVIAAVMVGFGIFMSSFGKMTTRQTYVEQEAKDLAMLHEALMRYRDDHLDAIVGAWGTSVHADTPTLLSLMTNGEPQYLPTLFANRGPGVGHSPFFQGYDATGVLLDPGSGVQYPIWVAGEKAILGASTAADPGLLNKIGVDFQSPDAVAGLKIDIVTVASQRYGIPAAYIPAGDDLAVGAMGGWTKDLGTDFGGGLAVADYPRAVVLVGYPVLEGEAYEPPDGGFTGQKWKHVTLEYGQTVVYGDPAQPSGPFGVDATCPAGTQIIKQFDACGRGYLAYPSDIGTITWGKRKVVEPTTSVWNGYAAVPCGPGEDVPCRKKYVANIKTTTYNDILLNGAIVGETTCAVATRTKQGYQEGTANGSTVGSYCRDYVDPSWGYVVGCAGNGGVAKYWDVFEPTPPRARPVLHAFCGIPVP